MTDKRRIGIAAWSATLGTLGGLNVYTRELVENLARFARRHEYVVLHREQNAAFDTAAWPGHVQSSPITHGRLEYWLWRMAAQFNTPREKIWDAYRAWRVDTTARRLGLDFLHFPATVIHPLGLKTACCVTFFDMQHEYLPDFFTREQLASRDQGYRPSTELATMVLAASTHTRSNLMERYATPSSKILVVPAGIDERFVRVTTAEIERIRSQYGLPADYVFLPAAPWIHKNHTRLLAALRLVRDRHGLRLPLVLTGKLNDQTWTGRHLAVAAGIEDQVYDLGFVPPKDLAALYSGALMMVFPSLFEGFGIPLLEAMATGCPIAASRATSIPEVVDDAALLFDPLSVEEIAQSIHALATRPELRSELAARGLKRVARFHWSKVIPEHEDAFSSVPLPRPAATKGELRS